MSVYKTRRAEELTKAMALMEELYSPATQAGGYESGVEDDGTPYIELTGESECLRWEFCPGEAVGMARAILKKTKENNTARQGQKSPAA